MIIGTAGHIDHGKTSLVKRLTGRDTDRLPEEIKRGISIDLGYAYVPLDAGPVRPDAAAGDQVLGFVDVPGHERFVHTMLAGATGIDFSLVVVAADDGLMPQTEEHVDIVLTLGVASGAIAVTKTDVVEPARVREVREELAMQLAGTNAAGWPVFDVSSVTGQGIDALDAHLRQAARAHRLRDATGHLRLAIDRCFTLPGVGTIVTGTVHQGTVRIGDSVRVVPHPHGRVLGGRVRSLHAQDRAASEGRAGQRCAVNVAGLDKGDVERGMWLQADALDNVCERVDASLRLSLREARALGSTTVHFHVGTAEAMATVAGLDALRVEPGSEALVALKFDRSLALCAGDRYVIRDGAGQRTLGGGVVLDPISAVSGARRGRRSPQRLDWLRLMRTGSRPAALAAWLERQPVRLERLAAAWNLRPTELTDLLAAANARVAAGIALSPQRWSSLRDATIAAIASAHAREPEMPGVERQRLARIVAPALDRDAFAAVVDELLDEQRLVGRGAFVALPTHTAELSRDQRIQWEKFKPLLADRRFEPPRVRDIGRATGVTEIETRNVLKAVARIGDVTLIAHDHFFLTPAVAELADIAAATAAEHGAARAAEFRDRIASGRKVAIQILEFFDRAGYTRRVRDDHLIRRSNPWK